MKRISILLIIILSIMSCTHLKNIQGVVPEKELVFEKIEGFPSTEKGIEQGVSACFAGVIDQQLVMAGGCNFPDVPVAQGGKKKFYQGIYAAKLTEKAQLEWQLIGWLPESCAYGVSVSVSDGLLCMGGCNAESSMNNVFKIKIEDGKAVIETYPSLPWKMDNFAGAASDKQVMVYDGLHIATLDLTQQTKEWQVLPSLTEEKLGQPVCGHTNNSFYVWGGSTAKTDSNDAQLMLDGWRLTDKENVPGPVDATGEKIYLGGATALSCGAAGILTLGGVNKDIFEEAVNRPKPGYMTHPQEWYRFNPCLTLFKDGKWTLLGESKFAARAGAALVSYDKHIYIIGGELKPGIRTPEIYRFSLPL